MKNGLLPPLSNSTTQNSVPLALFNNCVHEEEASGSKLLQTSKDDNGVSVSKTVVVKQDGSGDFTTINDAVASAPSNTNSSSGYFVIQVGAGVYHEYVTIPEEKQYLMVIGEGLGKTVITGNRNAADGFPMSDSSTFMVIGTRFVAKDITFRNEAGAAKGAAVALTSNAEMSAYYRCSFEGYQDTLCTLDGKQFYRECDIYGTIDYIFGDAPAVLQNCNIYSRRPLDNQWDVIVAQGRTDPTRDTGTVLHNCRITATKDLGTTKAFLGRPWKKYSKTVIMQSFIDSLIDPAGWHEWSGNFALSTLYYAEFENNGPGSDVTQRVKWSGYKVINANEAANFTVSKFLKGDDWLPATGVPYIAGLL